MAMLVMLVKLAREVGMSALLNTRKQWLELNDKNKEDQCFKLI